jgi:hypothetical protein
LKSMFQRDSSVFSFKIKMDKTMEVKDKVIGYSILPELLI